jgi:hypothetical protein
MSNNAGVDAMLETLAKRLEDIHAENKELKRQLDTSARGTTRAPPSSAGRS